MSKNLHGNSSALSLFLPQVRHYDEAVQSGRKETLKLYLNILVEGEKSEFWSGFSCKAFYFHAGSEMCCCCARGLFTAGILWAACFGCLREVTIYPGRRWLTGDGVRKITDTIRFPILQRVNIAWQLDVLPVLHLNKRNKSVCLAAIMDMYLGFLKGWNWTQMVSRPQWVKQYFSRLMLLMEWLIMYGQPWVWS